MLFSQAQLRSNAFPPTMLLYVCFPSFSNRHALWQVLDIFQHKWLNFAWRFRACSLPWKYKLRREYLPVISSTKYKSLVRRITRIAYPTTISFYNFNSALGIESTYFASLPLPRIQVKPPLGFSLKAHAHKPSFVSYHFHLGWYPAVTHQPYPHNEHWCCESPMVPRFLSPIFDGSLTCLWLWYQVYADENNLKS